MPLKGKQAEPSKYSDNMELSNVPCVHSTPYPHVSHTHVFDCDRYTYDGIPMSFFFSFDVGFQNVVLIV